MPNALLKGLVEGMKPTIYLQTDEGQKAIAAAAFELLERVGVKQTELEAQELLDGELAIRCQPQPKIPIVCLSGYLVL